MATIRASGLIDQLKGKLHGDIFQSGPGGNIIRGGKMYCRTAMYHFRPQLSITPSVAMLWKGLTPTERATWSTYAPMYPSYDKFGNSRTPSAYCFFMSVNATFAAIGLFTINNAQAPTGTTSMTGVFLSQGMGTALRIHFPGHCSGDEIIRISCTPQFSQGRAMPQGYWRYLGKAIDTTPLIIGIQAAYEVDFGALQIGQQLWVQIQVINYLTGERGLAFILPLIVQA